MDKNKLTNIVSISLFFSFMIFIFAPLEIFFSGREDFWFSIKEIIPFTIIGFTGSFFGLLLLFILIRKMKPKWNNMLLTILFALTLACYIQGNFFLVNYGQLNGETIIWSEYRLEGILSVSLWVLIVVVSVSVAIKVGTDRFLKAASTISICILLVQVVTLVSVAVTKDGFKSEAVYFSTDKEEFEYSQNENLIILLLDTFDSTAFTEVLSTENEKYKNILQDFTYYQNTLGAYSTTDLAIPQILTGKCYLNEVPFGEYLNEAYRSSPLFEKLEELEYSINVYSDTTLPNGEVSDRINNLWKAEIGVSSHKRLAAYMYKLVGFRYLPQPLKKYCWFYSDEMLDLKDVDIEAEDSYIFNWSNFKFYKNIPNISNMKENGTFHFYHLEGTHWPYHINSSFEEVEEETSLNEEIRGVMVLIEDYLEELRKEEIYEKSAIIIMADHGALDEHQCPVLLVKGMGENHEFTTSEAPVSYFDLQKAYIGLLEGKSGTEVFDVQEREKRTRTFYRYSYNGQLETSVYAPDIREYVTDGNSFAFDNLVETGKIFGGK